MHARTFTLLAVLAAPAAFAQYYHEAVAAAPMPAVVQQAPCAPRPAPPRQNDGRWELQTTQQYVQGVTQQVWVAGQCHGNPRKPWKQRCEQGQYVTTVTPGHYEARQEWVWVARYGRPANAYAYDLEDRDDRRDHHDHHDRQGRRSRVEFNVGFH